jgi:hypothetical protein
MKLSAIFLHESVLSPDEEVSLTAQKEYGKLVNKFYSENQSMIAPQQYEGAKNDITYFIVLIELTIEHYRQKDQEKGL